MTERLELLRVPISRSGAAIFDIDGTLVDSSAIVERHWTAWALRHDLDPDRVLAVVHGRPSRQSMRMFVPDIAEDEVQRFDRLEAADTEGLRSIPGAVKAVEACIAAGIPWAVVTSAPLDMATTRLRFTGFPIPEVLVTVEQTQRGKPAPDPYLRAAELLQLAPDQCTVFEDSPPGIASGKAAGMRVIALETTNGRNRLSGADALVKDFTQVEIVISPE